MSTVYRSLSRLVGRTPLVRLDNFRKKLNFKANVFAKVEFFNPAGSVKDRVAKYMLARAKAAGEIKSGSTVIEATSGNTGIALAAMCAAEGLRAVIVMPENMSVERRKIVSAYGAEVVLTPAEMGMRGAVERAASLRREIEGSIIAGQFDNPANPLAHFETTAPEIWKDLRGNVDVFVAGVGTGGTVTGVGRFLKSKNPSVKVVAVEPQGSPLLSLGKTGAHKIQGIGAGFVPRILDTSVYDEVVTVSDLQAAEYCGLIAKEEGLFVGLSSGAAMCAAAEIAKRPEYAGKNIVTIFPDGGDRYLSVMT